MLGGNDPINRFLKFLFMNYYNEKNAVSVLFIEHFSSIAGPMYYCIIIV